MAEYGFDGEGSGLEMVHVSDFLDYLGKSHEVMNMKNYDEGSVWSGS